jgi:hypothetical protein
MSNLEELSLHLTINDRTEFIDGNDIKNEILVYMPRLDRFNYSISTKIRFNYSMNHLRKDIQGTFSPTIYKQAAHCIINNGYSTGTCHVFSFPFMFDQLTDVGNTFPSIVFNHVRILTVHDSIPFQDEFFLRLSYSFPLLEQLCVINLKPQSSLSDQSNVNVYVKYPHLTFLSLRDVHIDYLEQFLNDTKTSLPCLTQLTADYNYLRIVTENFTRDRTRASCANVIKLNINEINVHSQDFHLYFPLL